MVKEIFYLLKAEFLLFILFVISILFGWDTIATILFFLFIIIPVIYILLKVLENVIQNNREKKEQELFSNRQDHFLDILEKYIPVLYKKKQVAINRNDYGLLDTDWWNKEKLSLLKSLKNQYQLHLSDQDNLNLIDYAVNNYFEEEELINEVPTNPYEYEHYCASILRKNGWDAKTTKGSGDHGVDIVAKSYGIDESFEIILAIQCKLYSSNVGNAAIQEVVTGMKFWNAQIPIVVTNANYTKQAIEIARVHKVYLLHHDDLNNLEDILCEPPVYL